MPSKPKQKKYTNNNNNGRQQHMSAPNANHNTTPKDAAQLTEADLQNMPTSELNYVAKQLGFIGASLQTKEKLIQTILEYQAKPLTEMTIEGGLEK